MIQKEGILFEQPISELTRVCLRLEYLFKKFKERVNNFTHADPQYTMQLLLEILSLLDRPDLKSKFTQELLRYKDLLRKFENQPDVDEHVLQPKQQALNHALDYLSNTSGKLGQQLISHDFLKTIRLNLHIPGNGSCLDMPIYRHWLAGPKSMQLTQFQVWASDIQAIQDVVTFILDMIRHSCKTRVLTAEHGFYHENLQPSPSCQLLRLKLDYDLKIFPEISAGKHRFTIRFLTAGMQNNTQTNQDITFELCTCGL